ncbi:hypothetical protein DFJ73DRAFT_851526 [Zopfochytrium polystomum]|nr:hypothetical protein DFJ73DRAFT_851526 [Zopfochytrium polystomum]
MHHHPSRRRRLLSAIIVLHALLALVTCLGTASLSASVAAAPTGPLSTDQGMSAAVRRRELDAVVEDAPGVAVEVYRRAKTANQKARTIEKAAERKASANERAKRNRDAGIKQQQTASKAEVHAKRVERKLLNGERKEAIRIKQERKARKQEKSERKRNASQNDKAHWKAAESIKAEMDADPNVKSKWNRFKDHVVKENSGIAEIQFAGPKRKAGKPYTKSVFLAPGDHSAEHPDLPNLSQKDGYSKNQVRSAVVQAFAQGRTGAKDATVEVSGKGPVDMKVFATGGGPGSTYPKT